MDPSAVRMICGLLAVILLVLIIMRRKKSAPQ